MNQPPAEPPVSARPAGVQETVVRNTLALGMVFAFNVVSGLVASAILTHLLGRDGYGIYGNYFRIYAWLSSLGAFILPPVLVRYVAELIGARRVGSAWRLLRVSLAIQFLNVVVVILGYVVLMQAFGKPIGDAAVLAAIVVACFGQSFGQLAESFVRGFQNFMSIAWANFFSAAARLAGYAALLVMGGSVAAALFVFAGSTFVYLLLLGIAIAGLWRATRQERGEAESGVGLRRRIVEYASTMGAGGLLAMITWNYIEMFFIAHFWEGRDGREAELAYYTLAIAVSALPMRVGKTMSGALLPAFSELYGSGDIERLQRGFHQATILSTVVGAFLCCSAAALAVPFIRVVYPAEMIGAVLPFQLLLIPVLFMSINHAGSAALPAIEGHRYYFATALVLAPVNLALDFLLIPAHGATGAATVNAIMQSAAILTGLYYVARVRRLGFPWRKVLLALAVSAVSAGVMAVAAHFLARAGAADILTLLVAGVVGTVLFAVLLAGVRLFGAEERRVLEMFERMLPSPTRALYRWVLDRVCAS